MSWLPIQTLSLLPQPSTTYSNKWLKSLSHCLPAMLLVLKQKDKRWKRGQGDAWSLYLPGLLTNRIFLSKAYETQTGEAGALQGHISSAWSFEGSFLSSLSHFHPWECFSFVNNLPLFLFLVTSPWYSYFAPRHKSLGLYAIWVQLHGSALLSMCCLTLWASSDLQD